MNTLTSEDINFLIEKSSIPKKIRDKLHSKTLLTVEEKGFLWDFCTDEIALHFDEKYELSPKGQFLEKLIDKLKNLDSKQYSFSLFKNSEE